jgi:hypothetical protein
MSPVFSARAGAAAEVRLAVLALVDWASAVVVHGRSETNRRSVALATADTTLRIVCPRFKSVD